MRSGFYRSSRNIGINRAFTLFGEDKAVALVELYDLGYWETHFKQKAEMGRRMGLAALAVAYGQDHVYTGPKMTETKIEGGRATVQFDHVGEGLSYRPSIDGISGVYLCGKDGTRRWGLVKVVGKNAIEVSHPDIAEIQTVAYAAHANPHETLFNSADLPASPFTVNPDRGRAPAPPVRLVTFKTANPDLTLHIPHVRRHGYVFRPTPKWRKKAPKEPIALQVYIPNEWKDYSVEVGGKPVTATETIHEGARLATFDIPVDGKWIIVAEKGRAAEFRNVNRY